MAVNINDTGVQLAPPKTDPTLSMAAPSKQEEQQNLNFLRSQRVNPGVLREVLRRDHEQQKIYTLNQDRLERHQMICRIQNYQVNDRFRKHLEEGGINYDTRALNRMSADELNDVFTKIKARLSARSGAFYDALIRGASTMGEGLLHEYYPIDGFTEVLFSQPDFLDCLEELKIDANLPVMRPGMRLMMIATRTALLCHMAHQKHQGKDRIPKTKPKSPESSDKEEKSEPNPRKRPTAI